MVIGNPFPLKQNSGKSFQGSIVLGKGFVLTTEEALALIKKDSRNKDVLFQYLNGDDLNNDPNQKPSRWVINFFDWDEEKAKSYPDCYEILERLVKPERQRWDVDKNGNEIIGTYALRKPLPQKWWIYGEKRPALYSTISQLDQVMVMNRYTKHLTLDFQTKDTVFSDSIVAFAFDSYSLFALLSSSIHDIWAWKNSSTMGSSTLRYSPTNAFETLPLPNLSNKKINAIGLSLNELRKEIMKESQIGFTELYNLFHDPKKIENANLTTDISKLRKLHTDLDKVLLEAYSWNDISLEYNFYEISYLPENDRVRFTLDEMARKEILKRLLLLNHNLHRVEAEVQSTLKSKSQKIKVTKLANRDLFNNE